MTCGVYKLIQSATGEEYVGSSADISRRWKEHNSELARGVHCNVRVQASFNKHGPLEQLIIVICRPQDLLIYEQAAMDAFQPRLNMSRNASFTANVIEDSQSEAGRERRRQTALRLHAEGKLGGDSSEMSRRSKRRRDYPELMEAQKQRMVDMNAARTPEMRSEIARKARAAQLEAQRRGE